MAIIVAEENVFPLADTPKHVPPRRGGKRLHKNTAFRWARPGVRGVKLETIRIAGSLCTSTEALQRFFERLLATDEGQSEAEDATTARSPARREREVTRARAALAARGI